MNKNYEMHLNGFKTDFDEFLPSKKYFVLCSIVCIDKNDRQTVTVGRHAFVEGNTISSEHELFIFLYFAYVLDFSCRFELFSGVAIEAFQLNSCFQNKRCARNRNSFVYTFSKDKSRKITFKEKI